MLQNHDVTRGISPSERVQPTDAGLALLAFAAGSSDAVAFLALDGVFTSAMTGNTALLGIVLAQGRMDAAVHSLAALAGFILGAATAAAIIERRRFAALSRVLRPLFALEGGCLACFAVAWSVLDRPFEGVALMGMIVMSAAAMGIQSAAARRINAPGINTIVFTSTLVSIVSSLTAAVVHRTRPLVAFATRRQIAIFLAYAAGATLAGALVSHQVGWVVLTPLAAMAAAFMFCELGRQQACVPAAGERVGADNEPI
jgi:uncharacterized membrane protein YoaK (UPF0700 family)